MLNIFTYHKLNLSLNAYKCAKSQLKLNIYEEIFTFNSFLVPYVERLSTRVLYLVRLEY